MSDNRIITTHICSKCNQQYSYYGDDATYLKLRIAHRHKGDITLCEKCDEQYAISLNITKSTV